MEIKNILASQAIRFFDIDAEGVLERRSPVPLINGIREKYGFVEVPKTVADLDFKKGVSFLQGYYGGEIIDKFQVYENGVLCEAKANTNLADAFMSELIVWAAEAHKLPIKETGIRAYVSQIEITTAVDIGSIFSKVNSIGDLLADALKDYGEPFQDYRISGLKMHYDSMAMPIPRPSEFSFERRQGLLYSTNQYYSSAPVRTDSHLHILEALERLLGSS